MHKLANCGRALRLLNGIGTYLDIYIPKWDILKMSWQLLSVINNMLVCLMWNK